jgi:4-diphosphocytidyl-2-C-methyl-D-erythritol kinase
MNEAGDCDWTTWPAPAKLNLFLRITGQRADGYHALQTVFRLLDWGDSIRLRVRDDGRIVRHGVSAVGVIEADDLAVRAAKALRSAANVAKGADIIVEKFIPTGAGLGGGSSDAATTLVGLDALWGTGWGGEALAALALELGADVPVFVRGDNAWAEGVGEQLRPVTLPPAWYLIVDPRVHVPTAALFQAPDLTRDAPAVKMADFVSGAEGCDSLQLGNAFEPVVRRREPKVEAAFNALARVGVPRLTGSGGACFVEFGDHASAQAALDVLPAGTHAWLAQGVSRSPLHVALDAWRTGKDN